MTNVMEKVWKVSLVTVLSASVLAACGNDDSGNNASSGASPSASAGASASASATDEGGEITIWNAGIMSNDDSGEISKDDLPLYKTIKAFEESNPNYKVNVVDYSMDQLTQAFTAANLAKEGPDIVAMWAGSMTLGYKDYLVDLSGYLNDAEKQEYDTSDITHVGFDQSGRNIGLPLEASTYQIYYNKQLLSDAGYADFQPKTWDELLAAAQKLKDQGQTPLVVGDSGGAMSTWAVSEFLGDLLGSDGLKGYLTGETKVNGDAFKQSMEAWKQLFDRGLTNKDFISMDDGTAIRTFVNGDAAMVLHGSWAVRDFSTMGDNVGIIKLPAITADAPFADTIVSQPVINLSVTTYTKHIDKSVELAKMLSSKAFKEATSATMYKDPTSLALATQSMSWVQEGHNVIGFDSIVKADAANEFYKMAPSVMSGREKLDALASKMDDLNQ
ncbi:ABC transporter substrate-binding protein [Paenibacillaceae bacterium WGS1546]|uniref:ABC transporter substrate-binding protein n=1 Tax=Cohnella sp. WGS1546 TaxID=3366810 RepID=UPI00372CEB14